MYSTQDLWKTRTCWHKVMQNNSQLPCLSPFCRSHTHTQNVTPSGFLVAIFYEQMCHKNKPQFSVEVMLHSKTICKHSREKYLSAWKKGRGEPLKLFWGESRKRQQAAALVCSSLENLLKSRFIPPCRNKLTLFSAEAGRELTGEPASPTFLEKVSLTKWAEPRGRKCTTHCKKYCINLQGRGGGAKLTYTQYT